MKKKFEYLKPTIAHRTIAVGDMPIICASVPPPLLLPGDPVTDAEFEAGEHVFGKEIVFDADEPWE